jgi:hypothetical protein
VRRGARHQPANRHGRHDARRKVGLARGYLHLPLAALRPGPMLQAHEPLAKHRPRMEETAGSSLHVQSCERMPATCASRPSALGWSLPSVTWAPEVGRRTKCVGRFTFRVRPRRGSSSRRCWRSCTPPPATTAYSQGRTSSGGTRRLPWENTLAAVPACGCRDAHAAAAKQLPGRSAGFEPTATWSSPVTGKANYWPLRSGTAESRVKECT